MDRHEVERELRELIAQEAEADEALLKAKARVAWMEERIRVFRERVGI